MNITLKISDVTPVPVESLNDKKLELGLAIINRIALANLRLSDISVALGLCHKGLPFPDLRELIGNSINTLQASYHVIAIQEEIAKSELAEQYKKGGKK